MKKIFLLAMVVLFILLLSACDASEMSVTNLNQSSNSNQTILNQNVNQEAVLGEKIKNTEADEPVVPETGASDTNEAAPAPVPALAPVTSPAPAPAPAPVVIPPPAPIVVPEPAPVAPAPVPEPVVVVPPPPAPEPEPQPAPAPASNCSPHYSPCVPIASDVDCAGGSGNGPAYVEGPVTVIGNDIYRLDSDHDGLGCE